MINMASAKGQKEVIIKAFYKQETLSLVELMNGRGESLKSVNKNFKKEVMI